MPNLKNKKTGVLQTNIAEVLINSRERRNYTFRYTPSGGHYLMNGREVKEVDFNRLLPVEVKPLRLKGENLDGAKNWMYD